MRTYDVRSKFMHSESAKSIQSQSAKEFQNCMKKKPDFFFEQFSSTDMKAIKTKAPLAIFTGESMFNRSFPDRCGCFFFVLFISTAMFINRCNQNWFRANYDN